MKTLRATSATVAVRTHGLVRAPYAIRALLSAAALVAAGTADVSEDAARWGGMRGPSCLVGQCLGPHACPGCGLVRSVASVVQGDVARSLAFHPGGIVAGAALLALFAWNLTLIAFPGLDARGRRLGLAVCKASVILVLAGWILRLLAPASLLSIAP